MDTVENRPMTKKRIMRRVSVSIFRISKYGNFIEANKILYLYSLARNCSKNKKNPPALTQESTDLMI
jgi:hypothetical protein